MNKRTMLGAVAAVVTGGVLACGPQPQYYRVAVDRSPLNNLPATCYSGGTVPPAQTNNTVDVQQWIVWEGIEKQKYLEVGTIRYALGNAETVDIPGDGLLSTGEGEKATFVAERTRSNPSRTLRATYTFEELGETAQGTIALSSTCTGTGCEPNCEATLNFVGRRLTAEPSLQVSNNPSN